MMKIAIKLHLHLLLDHSFILFLITRNIRIIFEKKYTYKLDLCLNLSYIHRFVELTSII